MPIPTDLAPASCSGISRQYVQSQGGYEVEESWSLLTVFARTSPVVITSFEIVPVSVENPRNAVVVDNECGGGISEPYLQADLDTSHISYEPPNDPIPPESGPVLTRDRNPYGRQLAAGQGYSIPFVARASKGVYRWQLKAHLLVDGIPTDVIADTSGLNAVAGAQPLTPTHISYDSEARKWSLD